MGHGQEQEKGLSFDTVFFIIPVFAVIIAFLAHSFYDSMQDKVNLYSYENVYSMEVKIGEKFPTGTTIASKYGYGGVTEETSDGYRVLLNTPEDVLYKKGQVGSTLLNVQEEGYPYYEAVYVVNKVNDNSIEVEALKRVDHKVVIDTGSIESEVFTLKEGVTLLPDFSKKQRDVNLSTEHGFVQNGYKVVSVDNTKTELNLEVEVKLSPNMRLEGEKEYTYTKMVNAVKGEVIDELSTVDNKKGYIFSYEGLVDGEPVIEVTSYDLN